MTIDTTSEHIASINREADAIVRDAANGFPLAMRTAEATIAASALRTSDATASPASDPRGSNAVPRPTECPWFEALWLAITRDRRRSAGLDATVRGLAKEFGMGASRVGDLLQIRDAFTDSEVEHIGLHDDSSTAFDLSLRGHAVLARLSFRSLRAAARFPRLARGYEAWRLAAEPIGRPLDGCREGDESDSPAADQSSTGGES
jgi:hypothetical protein